MIEFKTYAAPTNYVPKWRGNRDAWRAGKPYFYAEIEPLNDGEFNRMHAQVKAMTQPDPADGAMLTAKAIGHDSFDIAVLRSRVKIFDLKLTSNDGSSSIPKTGEELIEVGRKQLDNLSFATLAVELVFAAIDQSALAEGELKGSNSLPDSLELAPATSGNGAAGDVVDGTKSVTVN